MAKQTLDQKLAILSDAAKYDASCASSGSTKRDSRDGAAAVINPILSNHARGYHNNTFISNVLFPRVAVPNQSMSLLTFGKESLRKLNTRRAPGSKV